MAELGVKKIRFLLTVNGFGTVEKNVRIKE